MEWSFVVVSVIEIGEFVIHFLANGWERKSSSVKRKILGGENVESGEYVTTSGQNDSDMVEVTIIDGGSEVGESKDEKKYLSGYDRTTHPGSMRAVESSTGSKQERPRKGVSQSFGSKGSLDHQLPRKKSSAPVYKTKLRTTKTTTKTEWSRRTRSYFQCDQEERLKHHGNSV